MNSETKSGREPFTVVALAALVLALIAAASLLPDLAPAGAFDRPWLLAVLAIAGGLGAVHRPWGGAGLGLGSAAQLARVIFGWQRERYCKAVFEQIPEAVGLMVRAIRAGAKEFLPLPPDADLIVAMLQAAAGPGGTAPKAQALGYSVGGKTGTARKQEGRTYTNRYRAWFVGLAPVSDPRIVVAVMVDEPTRGSYYGGEVAAPVFSQVVQQTLRMMNVAPDLDVKEQIDARPEPGEVESF